MRIISTADGLLPFNAPMARTLCCASTGKSLNAFSLARSRLPSMTKPCGNTNLGAFGGGPPGCTLLRNITWATWLHSVEPGGNTLGAICGGPGALSGNTTWATRLHSVEPGGNTLGALCGGPGALSGNITWATWLHSVAPCGNTLGVVCGGPGVLSSRIRRIRLTSTADGLLPVGGPWAKTLCCMSTGNFRNSCSAAASIPSFLTNASKGSIGGLTVHGGILGNPNVG